MTVINTAMKAAFENAGLRAANAEANKQEAMMAMAPVPPEGFSPRGKTPEVREYMANRDEWIRRCAAAGLSDDVVIQRLVAVGHPKIAAERLRQIVDRPCTDGGSKAKAKRVRSKEGERVVVRIEYLRRLREEGPEVADDYARRMIEGIISMRTEVEREYVDLEASVRRSLLGGR